MHGGFAHECIASHALAAPFVVGHSPSRVHLPWIRPDEGFVRFNGAARAELVSPRVPQRFPNPLKHEPRRFLSHLERPCNLITTDSVLAVREQPKGGEPLLQGNRAVLEDRSNFDRKLAPAGFHPAFPAFLAGKVVGGISPAVWTNSALGPAHRGYRIDADLLIAKVLNRLD